MKEFGITCLGLIIIIALISLLGGWIFMLLWNWVVPIIWTNAPILTFWQAWGISFLLTIIGNKFRSTSSSSNK
jgi:hypothetical protein